MSILNISIDILNVLRYDYFTEMGCVIVAMSDKIKSLLKLKRGSYEGLASHMGIPRQSLHNKLSRNRFYAADLIKIADYLGIELAFVIDERQRVVLDMDDIKEKAE